ncbi:hypothetical protein GLOIN_2v1806234 [Rhizophagus irregularis DAOM 181602=DAOM 197198]|nr:hypothetical protein GLOIN_2v1806234 [Rhizophagus irregularis DAOM 181602=DAOM 197198]
MNNGKHLFRDLYDVEVSLDKDTLSTKIIVQDNVARGYKVFNSREEFWKHNENTPEHLRSFLETVFPHSKQLLKILLSFSSYAKIPKTRIIKILSSVVRAMLEEFRANYGDRTGVPTSLSDLVVMDECGWHPLGYWSYSFHIQPTSFYVPNYSEAKNFADNVRFRLPRYISYFFDPCYLDPIHCVRILGSTYLKLHLHKKISSYSRYVGTRTDVHRNDLFVNCFPFTKSLVSAILLPYQAIKPIRVPLATPIVELPVKQREPTEVTDKNYGSSVIPTKNTSTVLLDHSECPISGINGLVPTVNEEHESYKYINDHKVHLTGIPNKCPCTVKFFRDTVVIKIIWNDECVKMTILGSYFPPDRSTQSMHHRQILLDLIADTVTEEGSVRQCATKYIRQDTCSSGVKNYALIEYAMTINYWVTNVFMPLQRKQGSDLVNTLVVKNEGLPNVRNVTTKHHKVHDKIFRQNNFPLRTNTRRAIHWTFRTNKRSSTMEYYIPPFLTQHFLTKEFNRRVKCLQEWVSSITKYEFYSLDPT